MIQKVEIEIGAGRLDKEQTRRICKIVIDGQRRGRLSLTLREAQELSEMFAREYTMLDN